MCKVDKRIIPVDLVDCNGKVKQFKSMYAAAEYLNVSKGSITYNLNRNKSLKGYSIISHGADIDVNSIDNHTSFKKEQIAIKKANKKNLLSFYCDELEMVFRKLGYYDVKKLFDIKKSVYPYGAKVN